MCVCVHVCVLVCVAPPMVVGAWSMAGALRQEYVVIICRSSADVENVSGLKEVPKTEDFITFLCLRGTYIHVLVHK